MPAAPTPSNETLRLLALEEASILDTEPEDVFDEIVREAAKAAGAPIALISFISADRQWFKASVGLDVTQTDRDAAFCAWAIHEAEVMWVEDAARDDRFSDNPLVHMQPHIRLYAGAPISTPDGYLLGTLCVLDRVPRSHDPAIAEALQKLSVHVSEALERRKSRAGGQSSALGRIG